MSLWFALLVTFGACPSCDHFLCVTHFAGCQDLPTMAEQQNGEFKFVSVELKKTESLGTGSYGAVCKAKCDDLLCAAKVMHNVLFQFNDPGAQTMLRRFEQECRFLSSMKHPNIVQYLATYRDPDSGLPVLIMELMDESLTRFLERAERPPPIHTQVDFCHDIALALAYLHSNGIIHRDLSSNNVLLIGDRRAKVTDFGMSKLANVNPHITPQTMCPGTMVYMSPESLKEPPVYSEKLDCFSIGALIIQIATCNFPDPSERFTTLQVSDPRQPTHTIEVLASVPEVERRKTHIDLIEASHPLLPIALECIKDIDTERPSAHELCDRLDVVKAMPEYLQSKQHSVAQQLEDLRRQMQERESEIEHLQREKERESERHQQENEHLRQENEHLRQEVEDQKIFLHDKDYIIQEKDRIIRAKEDELQQYTSRGRDKEDKNDITSISWKESKDAPAKIGRGTTAVIENMAYFSDDATRLQEKTVHFNCG